MVFEVLATGQQGVKIQLATIKDQQGVWNFKIQLTTRINKVSKF